MTLIQKYLKTHTLSELYSEQGVESSFNKDKTLMSLNYSQIHADNKNPLACQCRGIILARPKNKPFDDNVVGETIIASYGFNRFFNEGQEEVKVNYQDKNLKVYEKLDGTCIFLYFYNGWKVATRSCPEADIIINDSEFDFSKLFKRALEETIKIKFEDYVKTLDKNLTYIFELTTPINMIVVFQNEFKVTLLGARDKTTLKEIELEKIDNLVPKVAAYSLNKLEEIITFVNARNGTEYEGVVICDSNFNRAKIKSIAYCAMNRVNDKLGKSERSIIELILLEKEDDALTFVPDFVKEKIVSYKEQIAKLFQHIDEEYPKYVAHVNLYPDSEKLKRKLFAEQVNIHERWADPFFRMYSGKCKNMKEYIEQNKDKNGGWSDTFLDKILDKVK